MGLTPSRGGDYEGAEPLLREAVDLGGSTWGRTGSPPGRLDDLGWLCMDLGSYDEALPLHQEAMAMKLELVGPGHKMTGITHMHMARAYQGLGDLEAALVEQEKAVEIGQEQYGPENLFTATAELGLARILLKMGQVDEAYEVAVVARRICGRWWRPGARGWQVDCR